MIVISKAHCKISEKNKIMLYLNKPALFFYFVEKVALKKFKTMFAHALVPWSALVRVLPGEGFRKLSFGLWECKSKLNLSYMIDHAPSVFKPVVSFLLHLYSLQKYFANCMKLYVIRGQVGLTESENEQPIFPLLARIA